jgi:tetratricopeptide (TPR) repeat protein/transcriptional regulator with XRE-family HTH domain
MTRAGATDVGLAWERHRYRTAGYGATSVDGSPRGTAKRRRLAQRRKGLGLTQEALAAMLDVERSTVARWEGGKTEPLPWIRPKLARALGVSAERLDELLSIVSPASSGGAGLTVPRQLPAAAADFTGRAAELAALTQILDDACAGTPGTVVITAVGGTAGVGKTALALHWAHQVAHRFGDGQLHVNLRGFDPSGVPVTPAEAVRGFLDALGVPPEQVPASTDAQAGLYRSLLADRRMLILLDNAGDEQQVRPLLPASPASLVIITSRNQFGGLAAGLGARLLTLDVLTHAEARQLLADRAGRARAAAEPAAVTDIAALCACLPLALTVAAARAASRPGFPLSALAAELRDGASRLEILDGGDPSSSVRAVFSWSYRQLSDQAARVFRLLGLHPGPDITAPAAASLAAVAEPEARRLLRDLTRDGLITEHTPGRYACHDLLRAYAADQARDRDSEPERGAAVGRVLDHYLQAGHAAAVVLDPARPPITPAPPGPGVVPERCARYPHAMAWFAAEQQVLKAVLTLAVRSGADRHAWQIPWAMMPFLARRGRYQELAAIQRTALAAATRLDDLPAQAESGRLLASSLTIVGEHDEAASRYANCLTIYSRRGDRGGEAKVYRGLGLLAERQGRHADALRHCEQALRLFRAVGDKAMEADMLNNAAWCHGRLGDYPQARAFCQQALALSAGHGHRNIDAHAWDTLGYIEHRLGNFAGAAACYERALGIFREFGDRMGEAEILAHLGDTRQAAGDPLRARQAWQQALAILDDLAHPSAGEVRAKLAGLRG